MKIAYADMWGKPNPIQSFRLAGLDKPIYCAASTRKVIAPRVKVARTTLLPAPPVGPGQ